jgi:hypothetical protein
MQMNLCALKALQKWRLNEGAFVTAFDSQVSSLLSVLCFRILLKLITVGFLVDMN